MRKFVPLLALVFSSTLSYAGAFDNFAPSFAQEFFFKNTQRAIELDKFVNVSAFGVIGRWMSPDAIATYNGNLNNISLNEQVLDKNRGIVTIKDAREIMGPQFNPVALSTIFHEMGHAELDVFIENERESEDSMLMNHYEYVLKSAYKKAFPGQNPHTVFHEHFGYYRGDIVEFLNNEMDFVLLANGYNKFKRSCYLNPSLKKKLAEGISLAEFQKLINFDLLDDFYRNRIGPGYVYVRGKDLDLSKVQANILKQTHQLFWTYHQRFYQFPINRKDLINRMNASWRFSKSLSDCRTKFWLERNR